MMEKLAQNLRYGGRMLRRNPGFTGIVVLILALGVAVNSTVFSMVKAVLLRPLPGVHQPDQLVALYTTFSSGRYVTTSYPDYLDCRDQTQVFSGLMASSPLPLNLSTEGIGERIWGEIVSGNYFQLIGVGAALGRTLSPEDDLRSGGHPVAVISFDLWQNRYGSDPNVVGKTMKLNGHQFTIVGVAARGFRGSSVGLSLDVYVPLMMQAQVLPMGDLLTNRGGQWLEIKGRLKSGVSLPQAQAALTLLASRLEQQYPQTNKGHGAALFPLWQAPLGAQAQLLPVLVLLMAVVGLVLLIACANVSNMLLARAAARQREMAIRLSLGASRAHLIRQLLTENLLLSLLGGAAGLLLTFWVTGFLMRVKLPINLPVWFDLSVDRLVLGFAVILSLATTLVFGLVPTLQASKPDLVAALKDGTSGFVRGRRKARLRSFLVVTQVALSLMLLISTGLLVRSLQKAQATDPGFNPENVLLVSLDLQPNGYSESNGKVFYQQLLDRVGSLPGVQSVTLAKLLPLSLGQRLSRSVQIRDYDPRPDEDMSIDYNIVGSNYLQTLGVPLVKGRDFGPQDHEQAVRVAIVNETMAGRFWPGQDPVGRWIGVASQWLQVIGVAKDGKYHELGERPIPYVYVPVSQNYQSEMTLHVRTRGEPRNWLSAVRAEVQALDKEVSVFGVKTLTEHMSIPLFGPRMVATLMGLMGVLALLLAAVGIYGVIAYSVSQRTREIGIRMALGARPRDVLKVVVGQGMVMALIGLFIGLAGAFALTRIMSGLLYGVSATDPTTFAGVSLVLGGVALVASYLPARQATKVEPILALRYE
jgi:predicted permease